MKKLASILCAAGLVLSCSQLPDRVESPVRTLSFRATGEIDLDQSILSALFHEIGERITTNRRFRGAVIDYENHVRHILGLPLRPYDLNHSNSIPTRTDK